MSHPGMGVMLNMLGGYGNSAKLFKQAVGKTINQVQVNDNALKFVFEDGFAIKMFDNGQSCCESRWMHTDDDLDYYAGSTLLDAELRDGPDEDSEYDYVQESQFLIISTSLGQFTVVNYNSHNGYYGGFAVVVQEIK